MGGREHQDPLFLGAVRESDTLVDVTPMDVHSALTKHFQLWYVTPRNICHRSTTQRRLVINAGVVLFLLLRCCSHRRIYQAILIYQAIMENPGRTQAHEHLLQVFSTVPTFDEFTAQVRSLRNNSAPGMSGCSYNMIKSWPSPSPVVRGGPVLPEYGNAVIRGP